MARRLLVSPSGAVHRPDCRHVAATAESRGWGQIDTVDEALAALRAGTRFPSIRRGSVPGPVASRLCACVANQRST